jgi:hypothetical protein
MMQDLNERIRKFMEIIESTSERRMDFWDKCPRIRIGEEFIESAKRLMECLTSGTGDLTLQAAETAFLCFLISSRGPEIRAAIDKISGAPIHEVRESEGAEFSPPPTGDEQWRG